MYNVTRFKSFGGRIMNYKIICESASNVYKLKNVPYECISATIDTCVSRYNDDRGLDISLMMDQIATCPSEIEISTPSVKQWFDTFKADVNFALCNTSLLSSSYNNELFGTWSCYHQRSERVWIC